MVLQCPNFSKKKSTLNLSLIGTGNIFVNFTLSKDSLLNIRIDLEFENILITETFFNNGF